MVGNQTLMFLNCITYNKKDKNDKPTGETGYILNMLDIGKNEAGELELKEVTFFPKVFNGGLDPFDLVECKLEFALNRKPALLEVGQKVTTDNVIQIMLPNGL